jgi:hypothetical protein
MQPIFGRSIGATFVAVPIESQKKSLPCLVKVDYESDYTHYTQPKSCRKRVNLGLWRAAFMHRKNNKQKPFDQN